MAISINPGAPSAPTIADHSNAQHDHSDADDGGQVAYASLTGTPAIPATFDDLSDGTTNKAYTATEKTKVAGVEAAADVTDAGNVGSAIDGATEATTVADANKFALIVAGVLNWISWTNLKAAIKTYTDTLYVALTGAQTVAGLKTFSDGIRVAGGTTLTRVQEGTWTPTITSTGTQPTLTHGTQTASYQRINNWVHFNLNVSIATLTSAGTGDVRISLPFGAGDYILCAASFSGVNFAGGTPLDVWGLTISGSATLGLIFTQNNGANVNLAMSGLAAGDAFTISGTYRI